MIQNLLDTIPTESLTRRVRMTAYVTFIEPIAAAGVLVCSQELIRELLGETPPGPVEVSPDCRAWVVLSLPQLAHQMGVAFLGRVALHNHRAIVPGQQVDFRLGTAPGKNEAAALFAAQKLAAATMAGTVTIPKELYDLLSQAEQDLYEIANAQAQEYRTQRFDLPECFVIMPMDELDSDIGKRRDSVYRRYIVPACNKLRGRPIRPGRAAWCRYPERSHRIAERRRFRHRLPRRRAVER
jgi:hypothetical protein